MENIKKTMKVLNQISEGILLAFLILAVFDGIQDLFDYKKDPFAFYVVGLSLIVYICFWQDDSLVGKWVSKFKK
jgi:hypothetical protein